MVFVLAYSAAPSPKTVIEPVPTVSYNFAFGSFFSSSAFALSFNTLLKILPEADLGISSTK